MAVAKQRLHACRSGYYGIPDVESMGIDVVVVNDGQGECNAGLAWCRL